MGLRLLKQAASSGEGPAVCVAVAARHQPQPWVSVRPSASPPLARAASTATTSSSVRSRTPGLGACGPRAPQGLFVGDCVFGLFGVCVTRHCLCAYMCAQGAGVAERVRPYDHELHHQSRGPRCLPHRRGGVRQRSVLRASSCARLWATPTPAEYSYAGHYHTENTGLKESIPRDTSWLHDAIWR